MFPYSFRFWQCLVRYKDTNLLVNIVNASKYLLCICIYVTNIFAGINSFYFGLWIFVYIVSTIFSCSFDIYMDWGLLRSKESGKYGLRSKILYPPKFYYFAMITNLFLRFIWILSLMP
jgi:hypothetical protein